MIAKTTRKAIPIPDDWMDRLAELVEKRKRKGSATNDCESSLILEAIHSYLVESLPKAVAAKLSPVPMRGRPKKESADSL